ncbi:hypothetical protein M0804_008332 [Polistes exclamans]|nr:hypothetical protein M0804_008332 [Polistes exclamans]
MLRLLGGLAYYLKWHEISTGSLIFRLHNNFTSVVLLAFSLIITANQYVGNPISCIVDSSLPQHVINTYCWITSTFTMPDAFSRQVGKEVAHPGVANDFGDVHARKYYPYYQWVCFVLFFQAILCYIPQWLWNMWEGKLMDSLVMGMNYGLDKEENLSKKKSMLMKYILSHSSGHKMYVFRYFFCELLCLVNIIGQLYLMNRFFGGEFLSYGLRILHMSSSPQEDRYDHMIYVFPRVTKCIFHKYGSSGTIQTHDSLCVLPLNIVNEKTYIFIWFWFMILSIGLIGLLVYRISIFLSRSIRARLLHLSSSAIPIEICSNICRKVDIGDWWILYTLSWNMDGVVYIEFIEELTKKLSSHKCPPINA